MPGPPRFGLGAQGKISLSGCTNFSAATGVAVTSDNNYVVAVSGTTSGGSSTPNIASLPITGGGDLPNCEHLLNLSSPTRPGLLLAGLAKLHSFFDDIVAFDRLP